MVLEVKITEKKEISTVLIYNPMEVNYISVFMHSILNHIQYATQPYSVVVRYLLLRHSYVKASSTSQLSPSTHFQILDLFFKH